MTETFNALCLLWNIFQAKPQPYSFGYETKDAYGNKQFRQEDSDHTGAKRGSYGYTDAHGIYRTVEYIADKHGFRAWIKTNEPGTANQNPADVEVNAVDSPVVHHAPAYSAPVHYTAPVHYDSYGSEPVVYKAPVVHKSPVVYKAAPVVYKAAPVAYKTPVVYKTPVAYKTPIYTASSPAVYKLPARGYKPHYRKYDDIY